MEDNDNADKDSSGSTVQNLDQDDQSSSSSRRAIYQPQEVTRQSRRPSAQDSDTEVPYPIRRSFQTTEILIPRQVVRNVTEVEGRRPIQDAEQLRQHIHESDHYRRDGNDSDYPRKKSEDFEYFGRSPMEGRNRRRSSTQDDSEYQKSIRAYQNLTSRGFMGHEPDHEHRKHTVKTYHDYEMDQPRQTARQHHEVTDLVEAPSPHEKLLYESDKELRHLSGRTYPDSESESARLLGKPQKDLE